MVRTPAFASAAPPVPGDVRLMRATANLLFTVAALMALALALNGAMRLPLFALRAIQVEGEVTRNSISTIRANAAPRLAGNFFTTDLRRDQKAFEAVPWVRQAVVRRVWPNRLSVQLEEHRAVALWASAAGGSDAADKLVNNFGEVFEANLGDVEDDALPTLHGPEGTSGAMLTLFNRLQPVFATMDARIDTLALSGRGSWRVELDTGAEIELGRGTDDEVIERTQLFIATLPQVTGQFQRALQYADLRHHDGYAVRLKGISTVDAGAKPQKK